MHYDSDEPRPTISYLIGLDLGQVSDSSALCVLQKRETDDAHSFSATWLHRWAIGTPYPKIVQSVGKMLEAAPFVRTIERYGYLAPHTTMAVDATGVGRPVVDMFKELNLPVDFRPVTITGGHKVNREGDGYLVPKRVLVSTLQVELQNERLKFAARIPEAPALEDELRNFQLTRTENANDVYEGRQGKHDDLVLAVALALWSGVHGGVRVTQQERHLFEELANYRGC